MPKFSATHKSITDALTHFTTEINNTCDPETAKVVTDLSHAIAAIENPVVQLDTLSAVSFLAIMTFYVSRHDAPCDSCKLNIMRQIADTLDNVDTQVWPQASHPQPTLADLIDMLTTSRVKH